MWRTGLVVPQRVGSSQTRARTRVPCIGRQILNHCTTREVPRIAFFFFLKMFSGFIYLFIFGCVGSSFPREGFLQFRRAGATLHHGARASHSRGLSCCGARAPDAQAQQLWLTGPAAPRHVGSPQTRARTRVPCTGRQTPNHRATREAQNSVFKSKTNPSVKIQDKKRLI